MGANKFLLLLLAAATHAAGVCWPWDIAFAIGEPVWALQLIGLAMFFRSLQRAHGLRSAAGTGLFFSAAWLAFTFSWLFTAMHTYGGLPAWLAAVAVLALAAALGLYYAVAAALWWRWSRSFSDDGSQRTPTKVQKGSALLFAVLWMGAELARGTWLTGFGWGAAGYAHAVGPLAALAPFIGSYGLAAVAAWVAASLVMSGARWPARLGPSAMVLGLAWALPALGPWSQGSGTLRVDLLQGNIPQNEKFEAGTGVAQALQWYTQQLRDSQADLVVAPETAIPVLPQELSPEYWAALRTRFAQGRTAAMLGIPLGDAKDGYTNSVWALSPAAELPWRYDKHHLVPFGEFIPPFFKWFTRMMNIPLGDFNRGDLGQAPFAWAGQQLGANICYEDLFGEELAVRFRPGATAPTIFVNVSNLAWFGNGVAIDQHLNISRMRALEFERPFVRATNTGSTAILDFQGRVVAELPRNTAGVLQGQVEGRSGLTPFAWWASRAGLWPYWLVIGAVLWVAWRRRRAA